MRRLALGLLLFAACATARTPTPPAPGPLAEACADRPRFAALAAAEAPTATPAAMARRYLELCAAEALVPMTRELVSFPTVSAHRAAAQPAFAAMGELLQARATAAGLGFHRIGADDAWELTLGHGRRRLGLVLHADVVPVVPEPELGPLSRDQARGFTAPGWRHPPFDVTVEGGTLFGRGVEDDKGPIAAALLVFETLAAFHVPVDGELAIIIGTGEEDDWDGMIRYAESAPPFDHAISLDANFPVVVGENGFVIWELAAAELTPDPSRARVVAATGGQFLTQIPAEAWMRLAPAAGETVAALAARATAAARAEEREWPPGSFTLSVEADAGQVIVRSVGLSAHSSTPEEGRNALWPLAGVATALELAPGGAAALLRVIDTFFAADHFGARLGLAYEHPVMGRLVVAPTVLRVVDGRATLRVNMRRPAGLDGAAFGARLDRALALVRAEAGAEVSETADRYVGDPVYVAPDSPLVELLVDVYRRATGDTAAKPLSVRGGTYARLFAGGVSFGPVLPGQPSRAHAEDESIPRSTLELLARVVLEVVLRLPQLDSGDGDARTDNRDLAEGKPLAGDAARALSPRLPAGASTQLVLGLAPVRSARWSGSAFLVWAGGGARLPAPPMSVAPAVGGSSGVPLSARASPVAGACASSRTSATRSARS
jgi:predicted dipeptidase